MNSGYFYLTMIAMAPALAAQTTSNQRAGAVEPADFVAADLLAGKLPTVSPKAYRDGFDNVFGLTTKEGHGDRATGTRKMAFHEQALKTTPR